MNNLLKEKKWNKSLELSIQESLLNQWFVLPNQVFSYYQLKEQLESLPVLFLELSLALHLLL